MGSPRTIAGYDVLGELGRGGGGVVLRASHRATGASRAIKLLDGAPAPDAIERFRREGEALARAGGAGVVPIHETGFEQGRFFYVMGLFEGGSLRARLRTAGRLEWRAACTLVAKLARTLERCHERALLHRDVKPENVLLDERDEPWIADFGCARDLSAERLTLTGETLGTLGYMPPEQLEGLPVDARADVFALGVLLHELLVGARPFDEPSPVGQLHAIRETRLAPVSAVPGVPRPLDAIVARALAADRDARTPSARALAADLEALLGSGGKAGAPRAEGPPRAGGSRVAAKLAVGVLGALVLAIGGVSLARVLAPSRAPPTAAELARARATTVVSDALAASRRDRAAVAWGPLEQSVEKLGEPGRVALDEAVAAGSLEAHELRAHVAARGAGGIPGEDVRALVHGAAPPVLSELARLALRPGIAGGDRVAVARELTAAVPTSEDAATLLAVELLALGTEEARLEAKGILAKRSGTAPAARALATALESSEAGGASYERLMFGLRETLAVNGDAVASAVGDVRRAGLARALPGLLRPFVRGMRLIVARFPLHDSPLPEELDVLTRPVSRVVEAVPPEERGPTLVSVRTFLSLADASARPSRETLEKTLRESAAAISRDPNLEGSVFRLAYKRLTAAPGAEDQRALHERLWPLADSVLQALEAREAETVDAEHLWGCEARFSLGREVSARLEQIRVAANGDARLALMRAELALRLRCVNAVLGLRVDQGGVANDLSTIRYLFLELGRPQDAGVARGLAELISGHPVDAQSSLESAWSTASTDTERRDAAAANALLSLELDGDRHEAIRTWLERARQGTPERPPLFGRLDPANLEAWAADHTQGRPPR